MHDHDDIDFAMLDLPTRTGPAKAATAPEQDPTERRLERDREDGPSIAEATGLACLHPRNAVCRRCSDALPGDDQDRVVSWCDIEFKHGSRKVRV